MHPQNEALERFAFRKSTASEFHAVEEHLLECQECQRQVITVSPTRTAWAGEERRTESRVTLDAPAKVKLLDPVTSTDAASDARVVDVSTNGARLRTSRFVCVGSLLQVRTASTLVLGEVRYCDPDGDGYFVGVRVVETIFRK